MLVTVFVMAATALALLSLRQQRIATIHDMSRLHGQLDQHRMHLWRLRARVATEVRPGSVRPSDTLDWRAAVPVEPDTHTTWAGQAPE